MDKNKFRIIFNTFFVVVLTIGMTVALSGCGKDKKENTQEVINPDLQEHVFGEPTPAGSLEQETPSITDTPDASIPSELEGLELIDQESLGLTSDIEYLKARTEKDYVIEIINGITYVDGYLIANKTYALPSDYVPTDTHADMTGVEYSKEGIINEAWAAWEKLDAAAAGESLDLYISSGYRSYSCQEGLYNNYVARDGKAAADTYSARAGHSEHQSGWCFDLNTINDSFAKTAEGKWVNDNCWKYGFIIRYPEGKSDITGYKYESWHLRYVGKELAAELYNNGDWITMEEYFGLTSKYVE